MKEGIIALIAGVLFGFGLCLSQMVNPEVVLGFLDVTGRWDPRLAFVMIGGLSVSLVAFPLILKRQGPVCANAFSITQKNTLDLPLLTGAILFGVGWGLAGICPGPAITALALFQTESYVFAASMIVGMGLFQTVK